MQEQRIPSLLHRKKWANDPTTREVILSMKCSLASLPIQVTDVGAAISNLSLLAGYKLAIDFLETIADVPEEETETTYGKPKGEE